MTGVEEHDTPLGPARTHITEADGALRGTLVLGHGAGGGVESADLLAVTAEAPRAGWRVIRVEQPWRVAGKRIAPAPPRLDEAWRPCCPGSGTTAGSRDRSCSAAAAPGHGWPAGRRPTRARPACSRWPSRCTRRAGPRSPAPASCRGVGAPSSSSRARPTPWAAPRRWPPALSGRSGASVYAVPGDHALKRNVDIVAAAALSWLAELTAEA